MELIKQVLDQFFSFQAYVMLPFFIFIIAIAVRMSFGAAFISALRMGVGFAGIFVIFGFFVDNIKPAVEAIIQIRGLNYPVLDVGWPPLAAITWSSSLAPISIPLVIGLNVLMLATNATRTIYIDIWNYWHLALAGTFVFATSDNYFLGLMAVVLLTVYTIKMSDWSAPHVEKQGGLPGVTISPISVIGILPFSVLMDYIYDKIPGLNTLSYNPQTSNVRLGLVSEPMFIGVIIGMLLGLAADYSVKSLLELSIHIAAVMFLLPQCGRLIGEGISPVSEALKVWIQQRFPKKDKLFVAVDTGVLMHHKSVMVTGIILMPIALLISLVLPGNKTLPLGDLPNLISIMSVTVLVSRGNVIRSVLTGIPIVATFLLIASSLAPLITQLSAQAGMAMADGQLITAFTDGGNHFRYYLIYLFKGNLVAICLIPVLLGMMFFTYRRARRVECE